MGAVPSTTSAVPTATATATTPAVPLKTSAARYIFTFGDSYTSTGFNIASTWPTQPQPLGNPTWPGYTSCNGANWVGDLLTSSPVNTLSYNFAVGGATVDGAVCGFPGGVNPFTIQASKLTNSSLAAIPHPAAAKWTAANSVFIMWFGVNDIHLTVGNPYIAQPVIPKIMTTYINTVNSLVAAGATRFLFLGTPPFERMPLHLNDTLTPDILAASAAWNTALKARTNLFNSKHPRAKAAFLDVQPLFNAVLDNPTANGAPDATCTNSNGVSCLWMDGIHPGQAIQKSVAAGVRAFLGSIGFFGAVPAVTVSSSVGVPTTSVPTTLATSTLAISTLATSTSGTDATPTPAPGARVATFPAPQVAPDLPPTIERLYEQELCFARRCLRKG